MLGGGFTIWGVAYARMTSKFVQDNNRVFPWENSHVGFVVYKLSKYALN